MSQIRRLARRIGVGGGGGEADEPAFYRLYQTTYGFVCGRARQLLRDEEEAADAAQETFTRAWERWRSLAEAKSQLGWLLVAVTRICIDRLRQRRPQGEAVERSDEAGDPRTRHLAQLLWLRLGREPVLRQQVVIHAWVDGMTHEETAELLGISRKTVQRQLDAFREEHAEELAEIAEVLHGS